MRIPLQLGRCSIAIVSALVLLAGCASLPGQGPNSVDITLNEDTTAEDIATRNFSVIALTPAVVRAVGAPLSYNMGSTLGGSRDPGGTRIGVGDRLTIRIWESSLEGLFTTAGSRSSQLPVVVNDAGQIYIPYVGNLSVSGLGLDAVRARIVQGLEGRVVDPEVAVILKSNGTQTVSVGGDAQAPGRFDIPASGIRLLDAVALAGGSSEASYNTEISVIRGGRIARVRLDDVVRNASNNIWLAPRDTIQIHYKPRSFTAFGAISSQKQQAFQSEMVSLTEALAQSGGLSDNLADESGVFIFRFESSKRVKRARGHIPEHSYVQGVPTIYKLDFNSPEAFFLAQSFMIHDKDILYVASAPAAEFRKFVNFIIAPFLTTAKASQNLAN